MKRKEPLDLALGDLTNVFDGLKVLDGDDEFELLVQAIKNNNDNCNEEAKQQLLKTAHQRYSRYLKAIDFTELPSLENCLNKYFQCSENNDLTKLKLIKQIDEHIHDILSSSSSSSSKNKKQCFVR
mgnify:CR=1 FL=1